MNQIYILITATVVALLLGGFSGYRVGSSKVQALEVQLKNLKEASREADKRHARELDILEARTQQIEEQAEADLERISIQFTEFQIRHDKLLGQKDSEINRLKVNISNSQGVLAGLREELNLAKTEQEKAEILAKIAREEAELERSKVRSSGLICLSAEIPEEYIINVNSGVIK